MKNLTLRKIQEITGGKIYNVRFELDVEISAIVSDSRKVCNDCLFLCIKGEKVDGHDFARQAINNGAIAVLAERRLPGFKGPYIVVENVLEATQMIAEYYRRSLNVTVVGVTGSVGKTSTKEFIASILKTQFKVRKTRGNLNNQWGVPFTIFDISDTDEVAVIEMGISDFGEMDQLACMARPDIAVITNIGYSHMEFFKSRDGITKAKTEIFNYLESGAHIVLNGDDDKLSEIKNVRGIKPEYFGLNPGCNVSAEKIVQNGFDGAEFDVVMRDRGGRMSFHVFAPVLGIHMIYNLLAAVQVAIDLGVPVVKIKKAIENLAPMEGRNNIIKTDRFVLIDDCYNASPTSMKSSLDVLGQVKGRKVAILGDMLELGDDSDKYHFKIGQYAGKSNTDVIICIGEQSEKMFMGARLASDNQIEYYRTIEDAMKILPAILKEGDTILLKASNGMHFSEILDFLQNIPEE